MKFGKGQFTIFLVFLLLITFIPNWIPQITADDPDIPSPSNYTPHNPISINADNQFTTANGVVRGSGIKSNPYVIENWSIDAGNNTGILIEDTDAHFIIKNCYVYNGKAWGSNKDGISIDHAKNGIVEDCVAVKCNNGIYIDYSDGTIVSNNIANLNNNGIKTFSSNSDVINNNTCNSNSNNGIYLMYTSSSNTVINNTMKSNKVGIYLWHDSDYNHIYNNYFENTLNHKVEDCYNNSWYITKTLGRNIVGGPYLGGNYWDNYTGVDNDGDGLGDTYLPWADGDMHPLVKIPDVILPELIDKTKGTPTTGDMFFFNASVFDFGSVYSVTVEYWFDDSAPDNVTMNRTAGNDINGDYSKNITVPTRAFYLYYIISATDMSHHWNRTVRKGLKVLDNDPPEIVDNTTLLPTTGDNFTLHISVTDNILVSYAYLYFWFDNNSTQNLTLQAQDIFYNTTIKVPSNARKLNYIISAVDNSSNWGALELRILDVIDNDKPQIVDLCGIPTTGDDFTLTFEITDNIEVSIVNLKYWVDDQPFNIIPLSDGYRYSTTIPPDAFDLFYNVTAVDSTNNLGYLNTTRPVIDNDPPIIDDLTIDNPATGNLFDIKCTVSENRLLNFVSMEYWFDDAEHDSKTFNFTEDLYELRVDTPIDALELNYIITADDYQPNIIYYFEHTRLPRDPVQVENSLQVLDIIPPDIFDLTENYPTTGDPFEIAAYATDNIMVESFYFEYWFDDHPATNDTFNDSLVIYAPSNARLLHYQFTAFDTSGNIRVLIVNVDVIDNDPPTIIDVLPEPTTGDEFEFRAQIFDNIIVTFSSLEYWFDDGGHITINFENSGRRYSTIAPLDAKTLYYTIIAIDGNDNTGFTQRTVNVKDNDPPTIMDHSTKTNETFEIIAFIEDNIGISEVNVDYWFEDGIIKNMSLHLTKGLYMGTLTIPKGSGNLNYIIYSEDISGNWNNTNPMDVEYPSSEGTPHKKNAEEFSIWATLLIILLIIIIILVALTIFYTNQKRKRAREQDVTEPVEAVMVKPGELSTPMISIGQVPPVVKPLALPESHSTITSEPEAQIAAPTTIATPSQTSQQMPQAPQLPQLPPATPQTQTSVPIARPVVAIPITKPDTVSPPPYEATATVTTISEPSPAPITSAAESNIGPIVHLPETTGVKVSTIAPSPINQPQSESGTEDK